MVDFGMPDLPGFAPPTHAKITLVPTAQGIKAFELSFGASLPINLAMILENALSGEPHLLEPVDARMIAFHMHIHRALVVCMPPSRPDLLLDMVAESGKQGPRNIAWLKDKLDPSHVGHHVKTILDIFGGTFGYDIHSQIAGVEDIISKARKLAGDFQLNNVMIALLIIFKLPESSSIRSDMIMKDPLPLPATILLTLQQIGAFATDNDSGSNPTGFLASKNVNRFNSTIRNCHNCDGTDHKGFECPKDKADCVVCGVGAGHLNKHCLSQCDRDIPDSIPERVKAKILQRRTAFFAKKETAAVALGVPSLADEDELLEWLADNDTDTIACGVATSCLDCDEEFA